MVFSTPIFLFVFLPIVLAAYWFLPKLTRNYTLLVASLIFYGWGEPRFIPVMLGSTALNYLLGLFVARYQNTSWRNAALALAVVLNLGLLGFYKYAAFAVVTFNGVFGTAFVPPTVALPAGISFFTFHALSYVIDIYRRDADAQKSPSLLALYISFFPQLVSGPIVRYHEINDQLVERRVTLDDFVAGVQRFILGLAKKMLIANTAGAVADQIFSIGPSLLPTSVAWLGIICYTVQIYFDFSGYSDMAIGLARLFGFRFPENFDYPYISRSMTEFWRRWHLSLSRWFRDYLYIPLGGNRVAPWRVYSNLVTVFFLCGLWHGASWNFAIWGLFHGFFLVIERAGLAERLARLPRPLAHAYVGIVVVVSWVFFRANDLPHAVAFLGVMAGNGAGLASEYRLLQFVTTELAVTLIIAAFAATTLGRDWYRRAARSLRAGPTMLGLHAGRVTFVALVLFVSVLRMSAGTYNPFIYFRF